MHWRFLSLYMYSFEKYWRVFSEYMFVLSVFIRSWLIIGCFWNRYFKLVSMIKSMQNLTEDDWWKKIKIELKWYWSKKPQGNYWSLEFLSDRYSINESKRSISGSQTALDEALALYINKSKYKFNRSAASLTRNSSDRKNMGYNPRT